MASKTYCSSSITLFLVLYLSITVAGACDECPAPEPKPKTCPLPPIPVVPVICPRDTPKLGVCADLLGWLMNIVIGVPPKAPCCGLLVGLVDLEAAVCLCTAIKANVLGVNLDIPLTLTLLLNVCSINVPPGFVCA